MVVTENIHPTKGHSNFVSFLKVLVKASGEDKQATEDGQYGAVCVILK